MLKATETQEEVVELRERGLDEGKVLIDDFKDLEFDLVAGGHETMLWWMKHYD